MSLTVKEMLKVLKENNVEVPKVANKREVKALYEIFVNNPESLKDTSHDSVDTADLEDTKSDDEVNTDDLKDEPSAPSEFVGEETQSPVLGESYKLKTALKVGGKFVSAGTVLSADEFGENQEALVLAGFIESV